MTLSKECNNEAMTHTAGGTQAGAPTTAGGTQEGAPTKDTSSRVERH